MKTLLSIVVTVYNSEKTIKKCIDAIYKNDIPPNVEVVVIDDCSTDESVKIIQQYVDKKNFYYVVKSHNEGIVFSRKKGIEAASGEYIYFVDSDDWIEPTSVTEILGIINKTEADIYLFDAKKHKNNNVTQICNLDIPEGLYSGQQIMQLFYPKLFGELPGNSASGYLWCCVIRKSKWNNIIFYKNVTMHEDEIFLLQILSKCNSMFIFHKAIYNYIYSSESLSNSISYKDDLWTQVYTIVNVKSNIYEKTNIYDDSIYYRLARFLYKNYIRIVANETYKENPKLLVQTISFLKNITQNEIWMCYKKYLNKNHFTKMQFYCICNQKNIGTFLLFLYLKIRYENMKKFQLYIKNEFKFEIEN